MLSVVVALALAVQEPAALHQACDFSGDARNWATRALTGWDRLDQSRIGLPEPVRATVVLFDLTCQYDLSPDLDGDFRTGRHHFRVLGRAHGGKIAVGEEEPFPLGVTAYASPAEGERPPTFVIALPEVWERFGRADRDPAQTFMAVFMHEFSHVQHMAGLTARFDALEAAGYSGFALGDDGMQKTFAEDSAYAAAWQSEMDAFTAAATAPDRATAAARLAEGRDLMAARRGRWLGGPDRIGWAAADDVFLTMEGAGQWAAWSWMSDPAGQGMSAEAAIAAMRTRWWSQEEGMMIMLALDKITPDWPSLTFGPQGATIDDLIRRALAEDAPAD